MIPLNRHGPATLLRKLRRWLEPDLDPARAARVFAEFDDERGYGAWHARCQAALTRPLPSRATPGPVVSAGFTALQVMSAGRARQLLEAVSAEQAVARLKRDSAKLEGYDLGDPALVGQLLEAALTPMVDEHCLEFFQSEYFVYWYTLSRTAPSDAPASVSFMWHCDKGPRAHLKLLVYLNDYEEHGGGTAYLDLDGSEAVARSGYVFARGRRRTGSLERLAALAGRPLSAYDHHPRAGDAVLFQPARVLHSGLTPRRGPRYVLTLCLLPSPVPWRTALARGAHIDLRDDPIWHDHARDLVPRLAAGA
ncbi:MAG: 2OG-Fe(II) oxygenase [Gammaproteobacteria bacterium]